MCCNFLLLTQLPIIHEPQKGQVAAPQHPINADNVVSVTSQEKRKAGDPLHQYVTCT
jgi:hypothetical protein